MTSVVTKKFFKFDETDLEATIEAKLTLNELNLWLYLCLLEPFGDRPVEIPPFEVIEQKLKISKSSYYSAKAKLQKVELWNFTEKHAVAQNLRGHARTNVLDSSGQDSFLPAGQDSSPQDSIPLGRTEFLPAGQHSSPQENRELKPREDKGSDSSQTFQTPQTFSYSPDPDGEKQKKDKQETEQEGYGLEENVSTKDKVENISSSSPVLNEETKVSTLDLNEDKNSGGCSINEETNNGGDVAIAKVNAPVEKPVLRSKELSTVQEINWQWLPEGAWKTPEGKLDPHFQEWFAKIFFVEQFGHEFNMAVANVESYFRNDLRRLPSRWKQYHKEFVAKLKNTSTLLDHDVKISDDRKKETINRVRAVIPVASEQSVSTEPIDINSNLQSLESIVNSVNSQVSPQNILNPSTEVNSPGKEIEAEVISAETLNDPWSEESALTVIGRKDTNIEVKDTNIEVTESKETSIDGKNIAQPKYTVIDNSDCPDPEVLSLVYRDFTGIAEQMKQEEREAKPINPLAKAMMEDFMKLFTGKPITRPESERIEVINYALIHDSKNKYFIAQAQQFINQGWKAEYNDSGEVTRIIPNSKEIKKTPKIIRRDLPDPKGLIEIAKKLNEALKDKVLRSSSLYINKVKEFLDLGKDDSWVADYDADGFPTEVLQF